MGEERGVLSPRDESVLRIGARLRRGLDVDPLTGLWRVDHDRFADALDDLADAVGPTGVPISITLADIDRFGAVNAEHGRATGDRVLASCGPALSGLVRPLDLALAGGGDTFSLVLIGAGLTVAASRAEHARERIAALDLPDGPTRVTGSLGVAALAAGEGWCSAFDRAFLALTTAKALGRDRVEVAADP